MKFFQQMHHNFFKFILGPKISNGYFLTRKFVADFRFNVYYIANLTPFLHQSTKLAFILTPGKLNLQSVQQDCQVLMNDPYGRDG